VTNADYEISCIPTTAFIQYGGFKQTCSVTYTGVESHINKDLMFCFKDELINIDKTIFSKNSQETKSLASSIINSHNKKKCYTLNVDLGKDHAEIYDFTYLSDKLFNEWDLIVGNKNAETFDLILDPFFNLTHYEI
jgi:hypothetical protein